MVNYHKCAPFHIIMAAAHLRNAAIFQNQFKKKVQSNCKNTTTIRRKRRNVHSIHREMGELMFERAFRMKFSLFKKLYCELKPAFLNVIKTNGSTN